MFVFETRYAPLYLHALPATFEYSELAAHFDEMEEHFTRKQVQRPTALLADVRSMRSIDAMSRSRIAEGFRTMAPVMGDCGVAHAIVMDNAVARGALTAIFWLRKPGWPVRTFGDMHEADQWLRSCFVERGLQRPPAPDGWWMGTDRSRSATST